MAARFAYVFLCALLFATASARIAAENKDPSAQQPLLCEAPIAAGRLIQPPIIDVGTLPLDDLGRHELIMRVVHDGNRFCVHYAASGVQRIVPPTLVVHRGQRFALRLVNEISGPASGATMKASELRACMPAPMKVLRGARFSGYLNHTIYARYMPMEPIDVNLHLHGFEGSPQEENVFLSTLSTPAHACEYDITVPAMQPPGTYFYHPHAHGMSLAEIGGGLSGMWIVEPDTREIAANDEHEIILRPSIPVAAYSAGDEKQESAKAAALLPAAAAYERALRIVPPLLNYNPFNPPPWPSFIPLRAGNQRLDPSACGFFAERVFTVNNQDMPAHLSVPADTPQLLRVLNALPNGPKYMRLRDASGSVQPMHVVGRDGVPISADDHRPLAKYVAMDGIVLGPSMRADILVTPKRGQTLTLYSDRYCSGGFGAMMSKRDIVTIAADLPPQNPKTTVLSSPATASDTRATELLSYAHSHSSIVRRRALTFTQYDLPNPNGKGVHPEFYITQTSNRNFHEQPYWPAFVPGQNAPSHADIVVKQGSIEEWYLFNATVENHVFHIHQMAFAAEDERPVPVMLDTVMIPLGTMLPDPGNPNFPLVKPSVTRILLDFRHVPRGEFVYHCHMLLHEDRGMMGIIRVE